MMATGTKGLITETLQLAPPKHPPRPVIQLAVAGAVAAIVGAALMVWASAQLIAYDQNSWLATTAAVLLVAASTYPLLPAARAFRESRRRSKFVQADDMVLARRAAAEGREEAQIALGWAAAAAIVAAIVLSVFANSAAIADTFFDFGAWGEAFPEMISAFWTNVWAAVAAEVLVLVGGLLLAVMRMLPGRAGAPLRAIALIYCDVFRAVPAIVVILLIVFGAPLAFPALNDVPPVWMGIVAISITYSAYVAEVFRAGLYSIHSSQSAAARSLGLSYTQTLRTVLIPQAVRRVIPPLLNDFIGLQKDTALLSTAAIAEVVLTSTLWQSQLFNLSPITLAAVFFILLTIPQARFVDYLIDRDAARRTGR